MLKSQTLTQKTSSFFANVFHCNILSWNCFRKHDIYKSIYDYSFKYIFIYRRQCSVENMLRRKKNHGTLAKMQLNFFNDFFLLQDIIHCTYACIIPWALNKSTTSKNTEYFFFYFFFIPSILGIGTNTCATSRKSWKKTYNFFYKRLLIGNFCLHMSLTNNSL